MLASIFLFVGSCLAHSNADETSPVATRDCDPVRIISNFVGSVATITDNASGENTKITVRTSKAIDGHFDGGFRWGGEGDTMPTTLIKSIIVQSEEKQLFVPLSAYSDLGDPHKISLKRNTAGFEITITGGDAGGSYNAVLVFEGGWLTYRRVAHGEFPDQAWEETRYFYNILDN